MLECEDGQTMLERAWLGVPAQPNATERVRRDSTPYRDLMRLLSKPWRAGWDGALGRAADRPGRARVELLTGAYKSASAAASQTWPTGPGKDAGRRGALSGDFSAPALLVSRTAPSGLRLARLAAGARFASREHIVERSRSVDAASTAKAAQVRGFLNARPGHLNAAAPQVVGCSGKRRI